MDLSNKLDSKTYAYSEEAVLERIQFRGKVDEVVWFMTHETNVVPLKQEQMMYLYDESSMMKRALYSLQSDDSNRMEGIVDGIKTVEPEVMMSYRHVIFFIQTSEDHPLMMSELNKLQDLTIMFPSTVDILWGLGVNDTLGDRLFFMLVCSK